jgi:hypothetical protein
MMTMTDENVTDKISTKKQKTPRSGKKHLALLTAGVLILAGGITFTSVSVTNANAEETARQCTVALTDGAKAAKATKASIATADEALEAVKSITLPNEAGTSTDYAARPAVEAIAAVEAVPAVEASEGVEAVPAVEAVEAVPARASGTDLITAVSDDSAALVKIKIPTECAERDEAAAITALVATSKTATTALDMSSEAVLADFAVFQTDEAARIAAEIEAARVAAEAEAQRLAAEEAARQAAAAEAARKAAPRSGGGGYTKPPSSGGGGGSYTPPAPKPAPAPPSGGGQVGPGSGGGTGCWTVDANGAQRRC